MAINTKKVTGRRKLRFENLDALLADAEAMASGNARTIGNWSQGQIYKHVGGFMHDCIDGIDFTLPWYMRVVGRLARGWVLTHTPPAGFQLRGSAANALIPPPVDLEEGLGILRDGVRRLQTETQRHASPLIGRLTADQWNQVHCRHAELHFSFIVSG